MQYISLVLCENRLVDDKERSLVDGCVSVCLILTT